MLKCTAAGTRECEQLQVKRPGSAMQIPPSCAALLLLYCTLLPTPIEGHAWIEPGIRSLWAVLESALSKYYAVLLYRLALYPPTAAIAAS